MNSRTTLILRAELDSDGIAVESAFQERIERLLGSTLHLPTYPREVWQRAVADDAWARIRPSNRHWMVDIFRAAPASGEALTLNDFGMRLLAAVSESPTTDMAMRRITQEVASFDDLLYPIVVLMSPSGDPIYAGGEFVDYRSLLAMERSRRNGAPMLIWQAYEEDRVVVDHDWHQRIHSDERFAPTRELVGTAEITCYLALPLHDNRQGSFGAIAAVLNPATPINASRIRRWSLLVDQVALAIRYSELSRRSRSQGSEAERLRVWNDIHAGVAQDVFALSLEVARAEAVSPGSLPKARHLVERIEAAISDLLTTTSDVRSSSFRFDEQLRGHCSSAAQEGGLRVTYDDTVVWDAFDVGFLDDIERIVVEALRNAVKHARATSVAVITSRDPDTGDLLLTITDDGVGGARQSATGRGLTIMDSVVAGRFGRMTLDSADGHGTTVQVRVQPLFASEWAVVERSLSDRDD